MRKFQIKNQIILNSTKHMIHTLDLCFLGNADTIGAFLIETSEGPILIESGPFSVFPVLQETVENKGFKVEDIAHVFLTHIHLDHAGAAWKFAEHGAKIYVHPFGAKHLAHPEKLMQSATRIYGDDMERLWSNMKPIPEDQIVEISDEEEIVIGNKVMKAWHTPGHAVHHIAWQWEDVLFTGDVAGVQIGKGAIIPPCPPPDIHLEDWRVSIQKIRDLNPSKIYLTHYGAKTNISEHLDELETNLTKYADWIKTHLEAGDSMEEMTPKFDEFLRDELQKSGMDEAGLAQYQAANPGWMSVSGLVRYWNRKKQGKI